MCLNGAGQCQTTPQRCLWLGQPLPLPLPSLPLLQPCPRAAWLLQWEMLGRRMRRREHTGWSQDKVCASLWALLTLPWITRAWLGCSCAVSVVPSSTGQWEGSHHPKSRRKPHAWSYPSPFIHLHSFPCTLSDFPGLFYVALFNGYGCQMLSVTRHWFFSCCCQNSTTGA